MLEKTLRLNYLFDFYQSLLTDKQREYMKMFYFDDLSLVEIAEITNVSRQAVYDNLKRTEHILESYENDLSLYSKFTQRMNLLVQLESRINKQENEQAREMIHKLKELG